MQKNYSIEAFANLLKQARKKKKLTQRDLAQLAGIPQSHLSNFENGKVNIGLSSFIEIVRLLELELVLIPRQYVPAIKSLMQSKSQDDAPTPAFTADEEKDEDE
jgi:HTH-type transcriptional regulator/antitoxin HipB